MLSYMNVIPAKESVSRGEALNLLGGVANDGEAVALDIRVWGRVDRRWTPLAVQRAELQKNEHRHLYFTLGPECFSEDRWGEQIGEIELIISDREPEQAATGSMIFVE